ncbi:hypothetical protein F511_20610 [Dorcoceras hygrometricum]|uniref:Uncharacterized protein n=1 Tax=Dorcoceras hygrometricum TaxID=472368 RepID=A0A2Z7A5F7_9LAMI|nr:hypothetical protein F511_20610 [Dorcoceras hygrometricum]
MAAAAANIACGAWPHAAAPSAALPRSTVRQPWRTSGRPPRNILRVAVGHGRPACSNRAASARPKAGQRVMFSCGNHESSTCVTLNGSGIQLAVGPEPLLLRNHNFGLAHRIMVKRLATSRHDPLGITDSACKNQLVMVSIQYGPFNTYIPIRSTTIDNIGYPRMRASGESSKTKHQLLHASGPHPIPPPNDPNSNEGSSIDHQVTIHLHAQNITMFPTNETWYFTSQMLVSSSGGLILILTAQSTRNEFRMHSDY